MVNILTVKIVALQVYDAEQPATERYHDRSARQAGAKGEGGEAPECVVLLSGGSGRSEDSVESHERPVYI